MFRLQSLARVLLLEGKGNKNQYIKHENIKIQERMAYFKTLEKTNGFNFNPLSVITWFYLKETSAQKAFWKFFSVYWFSWAYYKIYKICSNTSSTFLLGITPLSLEPIFK